MPQPIKLHLTAWGDPSLPPVVLLHGLTGRASHWAPVAHALPGYRVIAADLRGHGDSPRAATYTLADHTADVIALLEETGPAHLVGHSLGAAIAWLVATERPDLVRTLVLEDQHPDTIPGAARGWADWAAAWPPAFNSREEAVDFLKAAGRTFDWWLPNITQKPDGTWGWAMDFQAVVDTAASLGATDSWDTLQRVTAPTLLIRGEKSPHLKPDVASRMAEVIPSCRLVTVPGTDHWVHREAGPYARLLSEFFNA